MGLVRTDGKLRPLIPAADFPCPLLISVGKERLNSPVAEARPPTWLLTRTHRARLVSPTYPAPLKFPTM